MAIDGPVFPAGAAVSTTVSLGPATPFIIISPENWAFANLSFLVSPDGTYFYPLYINGTLWQVACPPESALMLTMTWPKGIFVKFLSGTVDDPVIQPEECVFRIV
jgi:hypothetical protein